MGVEGVLVPARTSITPTRWRKTVGRGN